MSDVETWRRGMLMLMPTSGPLVSSAPTTPSTPTKRKFLPKFLCDTAVVENGGEGKRRTRFSRCAPPFASPEDAIEATKIDIHTDNVRPKPLYV